MEKDPAKTGAFNLNSTGEKAFRFSMWSTVFFFITVTTCGLFGMLPKGFSIFNNDDAVLSRVHAQEKQEKAGVVQNSKITKKVTALSPSWKLHSIALKSPEKISTVPIVPQKKYSALEEKPVRIVISKIGVDSGIENPSKSASYVLDDALTRGVVRYPGSGLLGERGNVFLLGHSSHLKVVYNKAYRAFNEINKLETGDEIKVYSAKKMYTYKVMTVSLMKNTEAKVSLDSDKPKLTLVTCNNFGAKEDRFIVEAELANN